MIENIIEGEEIEWCLKKVEKAENKELTNDCAVHFFRFLTEHSESFLRKRIEDQDGRFSVQIGAVYYQIWKSHKKALVLTHNTSDYTELIYYDYLTFKIFEKLNSEMREAYKQEIIENYKEMLIESSQQNKIFKLGKYEENWLGN